MQVLKFLYENWFLTFLFMFAIHELVRGIIKAVRGEG